MVTPYYDDGKCVIYHGDCREIWQSLGVAPGQALITDPPYGMGHYATDVEVGPAVAMITSAHRVSGVFGYPERLVAWCVEHRLRPTEWITWWPTNAAIKAFNLSGLSNESECVAIFGDAPNLKELRQPRSAALMTAYVRREEPTGRQRLSDGQPESRRLGDVWTDAAPGLAFQSHNRLHPNEKPLSLMSRIVLGLTWPGDWVFDPFAGSGTTLRAAKNLGRRAIGIEIEERYCEIAAKRLQQEVLPMVG